jgi:hypothetical protein
VGASGQQKERQQATFKGRSTRYASETSSLQLGFVKKQRALKFIVVFFS